MTDTSKRSHHAKPKPPAEVAASVVPAPTVEPAPAASPLPGTPPEITAAMLEGRQRLSPAEVQNLDRIYRDVCLADDDDAKALQRRVIARLRRCSHEELHPGCIKIVIDVPRLKLGDVRINEKPYVGRCEVWYCEAQTILGMVHQALAVEDARMREDGEARAANTIDLDRGGLAARARAIQSA